MEKIIRNYKTFDDRLKKLNYISYALILMCFLSICFFGFLSYYYSSNNLIVIDKDGDIASAVKSNEMDYFEIEADNHIRLFYQRFFTYNKNTLKEQLDLGLGMCGPSAKRLYETYKNANWYSAVVNDGLILESYVIGNIEFQRLNNRKDAFLFFAEGRQKVSKGDQSEIRYLNIKGTITKGERIKRINPHGLIIDDIVVVNNSSMANN